MPILGERKKLGAEGYDRHPMYGFSKEFCSLNQNILTESTMDFGCEPLKSLKHPAVKRALKDYFVENAIDEAEFVNDPQGYEDQVAMLETLFENDVEAINESSFVGEYNPVMGMTFPVHKNILMNCIFDKGAIPKAVTQNPKFTLSLETRELVKPDGTVIDMYLNQKDMTAAINETAPYKEVELTLPEIGATNIVTAIGGSSLDHINIDATISAVCVTTKTGVEEAKETWIPVNLKFTPGYQNNYSRSIIETIDLTNVADLQLPSGVTTKKEIISGGFERDKFTIMAASGIVTKVKLRARKDTSNGLLNTCSVRWSTKTSIEEIDTAIPINVTVSPEEVKDIAALYDNTNQVTKLMSMIKLVMENYKDDMIHSHLDDSYNRLSDREKFPGTYNFAPRQGYYSDHVEWRGATFMDRLDGYVTKMLQVLNDPNMTITVIGAPSIVRRLTPKDYTYTTPASIGPVELEFTKTIINSSDKRVYQFYSTQKMEDSTDLIVLLCPRNTNRIIYRVYDYQMYISNEIRNAQNSTLPSIHAFERWKFVEYQPVQGRITVTNPTGLEE